MGRIIENNQVRISGEMTSDFGFSHEVFGEGFYTAQITIRRESGQKTGFGLWHRKGSWM